MNRRKTRTERKARTARTKRNARTKKLKRRRTEKAGAAYAAYADSEPERASTARPDKAPDTGPRLRTSHWFKYFRTNDKYKKTQRKMPKHQEEFPFSIDGLSDEERALVMPYYTEKQLLHTLPMYVDELPPSNLRWSEDDQRDTRVARHKCSVVHYGQRKLLLNELLFLSMYGLRNYPEITQDDLAKHDGRADVTRSIPKNRETPIVVYAGAGGTGQHLLLLCKLFTGVMFYCYDMSEYDRNLQGEVHEGNFPNVELHVALFAEEARDHFAYLSNQEKRPIYFVSDIRSGGKDLGHAAFEERVHADNLAQYDWVEAIRPVVAHLKWRIPYTHQDAPIMTPCRFMLEPWVDADSGELRQMVERPPDGAPYAYDTMTLEQFENKKMMHNNVISPYAYYEHPVPCSGYYYYDEEEKHIDEAGHGLDHCWSCAYELASWCVYLGFDHNDLRSPGMLHAYMKNHEAELRLLFNQSTLVTCRSLNINCHGMMPDKTSHEKYLAFSEADSETRRRFMEKWSIGERPRLDLECEYEHVDRGDSHFNPKNKENKRASTRPTRSPRRRRRSARTHHGPQRRRRWTRRST